MLSFTGERIVPQADNCEPNFALKMYQEHLARYLFASQVCAGKAVLDIGCGVGYGAHALVRVGAASVVAFDISEDAVRHAEEFYSHPSIEFRVASAESFSFDRKFDVITCFELIEHVENQHAVIRAIENALAPGGRLVMSTPRPLDRKRSAFHTRELTSFDFVHLLETRFPHLQLFFENNHFVSLVARDRPHLLNRIHTLHRQFTFEQADYMIVVASTSAIDEAAFEPQLVINDDRYVRLLESDNAVLREAETRIVEQIESQAGRTADLEHHLTETMRALAMARRERDDMATKAESLESALRQSNHSIEALSANFRQVVGIIDIHSANEMLGEAPDANLSADAHHTNATLVAQRVANVLSKRGEQESDLRVHLSASLRQVSDLRAEVDRLSIELRRANTDLAGADARVQTLEANQQAQLRDALQQVERSEERVRSLEAQAQARTAENEALTNELARQTRRRENLETSLAATHRTLAERDEPGRRAAYEAEQSWRTRADAVTKYAAFLHDELRVWRHTASVLHHHVEALRPLPARINDYRQKLEQIFASKSWQVTMPLRLGGGLDAKHLQPYTDTPTPPAVPLPPARRYAPETGFDEDAYLRANPDVANALREGAFESAYDHWVQHGWQEAIDGLRSNPMLATTAPPPTVTAKTLDRPTAFPYRAYYDVLYIIGCHDGESKRYRVHNVIESLTARGYKGAAFREEDIPELIKAETQAHRIVIFRSAYNQSIAELLAYARRRNIVTVCDIDDLIVEPENIHYVRVLSTFTPEMLAQYRRDIERYRKVMLETDFTTCTTAFLAARVEAAGKPARVIPNSLNVSQVATANELLLSNPPRDTGRVRIGYFSGSNTHQVDFRSCEPGLLRILRQYPQTRFVLVGILDLGPAWQEFQDRVERIGMLPYVEMLRTLAGIDINLAPLEHGNPYCESKSQLKIFEAGLVRVPTVASAIASYGEAVTPGVDGFLASTEDEWYSAMAELVESSERRREVGRAARERALAQFGPEAVADIAANVYELAKAPVVSQSVAADANTESPSVHIGAEKLDISWIVPGLIIGSGGHRNILRAAYHLSQFGHRLRLYFTSTDWNDGELREKVNEHFYPLDCPIHRYDGSIAKTDVLFATHWSTVEPALRSRSMAGEIMYFVQDFEPLFAPMGTEYVLAENTYRQGLYCITSGPWCSRLLRRDYGCEADYFEFPVDSEVYRPRERTKTETNILFFAKPEMPRRCYELGIMALDHVHRRRPEIEIQLFGSGHLKDRQFPFPAKVLSIVPTIDDLAQMYSNADLGIVFSTTNPSLVPYEMMACGLPVVDLGREGNEINYGGRKDIALLADPAPEVMAHQVCQLLEDKTELGLRSRNGLQLVGKMPSEAQMARRVEELILRRFAKTTRAGARR